MVLGKIKQGTTCTVEGCNEKAVRSVASDKVTGPLQQAEATLTPGRLRRAYLCKNHYKVVKKGQRQEKKVEKWRHST